MKKLIACLLVIVMMLSTLPILAEEEIETGIMKLIKMVSIKDVFTLKEEKECCQYSDDDGHSIQFDTICITDMNTGEKTSGIWFKTRMMFSLMDYEEINNIIMMLEYIKDNIDALEKGSEYGYTSYSGVEIQGKWYGDDAKIISVKNGDDYYKLPITEIEKLISSLSQCKEALEAM